MKSKFNKLFVTILLVVAVTCCGAFGVMAADNTFGKSLIFVALGESIALYGLVISIMILSKLV